MGLHKMVNGVRVECTPEECNAIEAEWAKNREEQKLKIEQRKAKERELLNLKASAMDKLRKLGLDDAEIDALMAKKPMEKEGA